MFSVDFLLLLHIFSSYGWLNPEMQKLDAEHLSTHIFLARVCKLEKGGRWLPDEAIEELTGK